MPGGMGNDALPTLMQNDLVKRLLWSGLLAGLGAVATMAVNKVATQIWERVFDEEPPQYS